MIKFEPTSYVVARRLEGDIECIAHCAGQKAAKASDYKDLLVWQKGMELARRVYRVTQTFPGEKKFGLVSWSSRCARRLHIGYTIRAARAIGLNRWRGSTAPTPSP